MCDPQPWLCSSAFPQGGVPCVTPTLAHLALCSLMQIHVIHIFHMVPTPRAQPGPALLWADTLTSVFPRANPCVHYLPHDPITQGTAWVSSGAPSLPPGGAPFPMGLRLRGCCRCCSVQVPGSLVLIHSLLPGPLLRDVPDVIQRPVGDTHHQRPVQPGPPACPAGLRATQPPGQWQPLESCIPLLSPAASCGGTLAWRGHH